MQVITFGVRIIWVQCTDSHTSHIDVRDIDNATPLHYACLNGHKDIVQWLVEECKFDVGESFL